jgi:Holliday junction resolvasome RuvABC endonuclease subunit
VRVVGIDPGLAHLGIVGVDDVRLTYTEYVQTDAGRPIEERLAHIARRISAVLDCCKPDLVGIEDVRGVYHGQTRKGLSGAIPGDALLLCMGLALGLGVDSGARVCLVPPTRGKKALALTSKASKMQMMKAALQRFGRELGEHEADALGVALAARGRAR